MLTRFEVEGFKNLRRLDLRFGPLTCIAGQNGAGKSNILDALSFFALLADRSLLEAAKAVRGGGEEPRRLFSAMGNGRIRFRAELIIPARGMDDLGQRAEASATLVEYEVSLALEDNGTGERIRLETERLDYIAKAKAKESLGFDHSDAWRDGVVRRFFRRVGFISTEGRGRGTIAKLHSDRMRSDGRSKRGGGKFSLVPLSNTPRTVLSTVQNAEEHRTAMLVRQELRSWRLLQLEPSSLRRPDEYADPDIVDATGKHVPAALLRLAQVGGPSRVHAEIANRLAGLVEDVRGIRAERDESRRIIRLLLMDRHGLELPASSLSDGTLRFLAMAVMTADPRTSGLVCFEEPENGIHPQRMGAMVNLLYDLAADPMEPSDRDNPLRQVVVTTHSPVVAGLVRDDDLLFAGLHAARHRKKAFSETHVRCIDATWRQVRFKQESAPRGAVLAYLRGGLDWPRAGDVRPRVMDRFGDQLLLPLGESRVP